MTPFEFHAELFDVRNSVLEILSDGGYVWLSDFDAVDLLHDVYGFEVTAIPDEGDARAIERLLRRRFPAWRHGYVTYNDYDSRSIGWKVVIARDPERGGDTWERVG